MSLHLSASLLGHDVRFSSNSGAVIEHVREMVTEFRGMCLTEPATPRLSVRIDVGEQSASRPALETPQFTSASAGRLTVNATWVVGEMDPSRRASRAHIDPAALDAPVQLREFVIEALTLALLSHYDRHPIHAAAIEHQNRAVLFAGPGGSGKSTIAHLANREGYRVLSEDCARVQLDPMLRVWGGPARIRLRTNSTAKQVVSISSEGPAFADAVNVCILARGESAHIDRLSSDAIRDHLERQIAPGFDRFPARQASVLTALAKSGGWQLTLSANPEDALPYVRTLLEECER